MLERSSVWRGIIVMVTFNIWCCIRLPLRTNGRWMAAMFRAPCSMLQPQQLSNKPEKWRLFSAPPVAGAALTTSSKASGSAEAVASDWLMTRLEVHYSSLKNAFILEEISKLTKAYENALFIESIPTAWNRWTNKNDSTWTVPKIRFRGQKIAIVQYENDFRSLS